MHDIAQNNNESKKILGKLLVVNASIISSKAKYTRRRKNGVHSQACRMFGKHTKTYAGITNSLLTSLGRKYP